MGLDNWEQGATLNYVPDNTGREEKRRVHQSALPSDCASSGNNGLPKNNEVGHVF